MCVCFLGKKLSDLERVTSLKVYNWFANRRKDIKRRANIGNVFFCVRGNIYHRVFLLGVVVFLLQLGLGLGNPGYIQGLWLCLEVTYKW